MPCDLCGEDLDKVAVGGVRPAGSAHRECYLREVVGGIGHCIAHDYWCKEHHDPDAGLTYRQSALLVWTYYHVIGMPPS